MDFSNFRILSLGLALIGSTSTHAITCDHPHSHVAVEAKVVGDEMVVTMMGREGATLEIAKSMRLPQSNESYRYVTGEMRFPAANCRTSPIDPLVITCGEQNALLKFLSPAVEQEGSGGVRIIRRTEFDADGNKIDTHDFQLSLFYSLGNGSNALVTQTFPGLECH